MPLPVTSCYEQRLQELRALAPAVAALAEDIATLQEPGTLTESTDSQTRKLFDRLDEVARQETACALRLGVWLFSLYEFGVLTKPQVETFIDRAIALGGPSAVVPAESAESV